MESSKSHINLCVDSCKPNLDNKEILVIKASGCAKKLRVDYDLQVCVDIANIISVAENYGLGMAQGWNGYVEVWIDDNKSYRCQATYFPSETTRHGAEGNCPKNQESLQVGTKEDAEIWLKEWWAKMNDLSKAK